MPPHLFVDISSHGFGHLAQTAPVLNALRAQRPDLQLTIRSGLPRARLARRVAGAFRHIPAASDFGLCMQNALDVDIAASLGRYQALHADWDAQVQAYAREIRRIQPTLLLANVSYLALAAARAAHIPALAMCSLNWLDVFFSYVAPAPGLAHMQAQILQAYRGAAAFLRLTPGMPMPHFENIIDIGPIASRGAANPGGLRERLGLGPETRLILFAMGGIALRLPSTWPRLPGHHWIVPRAAALQRDDMHALEAIDLPFGDVLASCDCVFSKSAYGVFVESTVCGTPVLYVERPDWPEEPCLVAWLKRHNRAQGISRAQFEQGAFAHALAALLQGPRPAPLAPSGIDAAAGFIQAQLAGLD